MIKFVFQDVRVLYLQHYPKIAHIATYLQHYPYILKATGPNIIVTASRDQTTTCQPRNSYEPHLGSKGLKILKIQPTSIQYALQRLVMAYMNWNSHFGKSIAPEIGFSSSTHGKLNAPCLELLKPISGAIFFSWCVFQSLNYGSVLFC